MKDYERFARWEDQPAVDVLFEGSWQPTGWVRARWRQDDGTWVADVEFTTEGDSGPQRRRQVLAWATLQAREDASSGGFCR